MDESTRKQLVDDHFLFKKGDRFLESAGINNYWPNGRGIFFNNNKTFLVWVNEEDQLRYVIVSELYQSELIYLYKVFLIQIVHLLIILCIKDNFNGKRWKC